MGEKSRVELSSYKKAPSKLWIFSLETLTQVHYSDPTIFSNLKKKYLKKIFFLQVSNLITFFLQSLKVDSLSALMFTIITQSDLLLKRYLKHPIQLILMETQPYLTMPTQ